MTTERSKRPALENPLFEHSSVQNGSGGATQLSMVFHQSDDNQITIPDHGMIFSDECHVTLTNIDSITGFFG